MRPLLVTALAALLLCACTDDTQSLLVTPQSLLFGEVPTGTKARKAVTLENLGDNPRELILSASAPYSAVFSQVSLPGRSKVEVLVEFAPTTVSALNGTLVVRGGTTTISVSLTGKGVVATVDGCGNAPLCRQYRRVDGGCELEQAPNGAPCSTRCAPEGLCSQGACEGFNPDCDDQNACTTDSCSNDTGCANMFVCESNSPCQVPLCIPATGCTTSPVTDGTPCGSTACGAVDLCQSGTCERLNQTTPNCTLNGCGTTAAFSDCTQALCPENPLPALGGFVDGDAVSANDVWFASRTEGVLYRFDGGSITPALQPGGELTGVVVRAPNDIWVTARDRFPRRWNGTAWTTFSLPGSDPCLSIAPISNGEMACASNTRVHVISNDGVVTNVGNQGGVVRAGGGATWSITGGEVRRVLGSAGMSTMGTLNGIRDLTVDNLGRAWVSTSQNAVFRFDAVGMSTLSTSSYIEYLGAAGSRVFAWSPNSRMFSVETLTPKPLPNVAALNWGDGASYFTGANENDVWIQGQRLEHFDGIGTTQVGCGFNVGDITHVRALPDGGALAASYSNLHRRDRSNWVPATQTGTIFQTRDMFVASPDEAWLVNESGVLRPFTADGGLGSPQNNGYATAVWGTSMTDVWAGFSGGSSVLQHWNGGTWTPTASPDGGLGNNLWIRSIHGSGPNDVWALGRNNYTGWPFVWRWDGAAWRDEALPQFFNGEESVRRSGGVTRVNYPFAQRMMTTKADGGWLASNTPYGLTEAQEINGRVVAVSGSTTVWMIDDAGTWQSMQRVPTDVDTISPAEPGTVLVGGRNGYIAKLRVR